MSDLLEQLSQALKQRGQSLTRPRQIIFTALQNSEPQTMQQLVLACAGQVDRASVYRTIALFEKLDIVQRLQIGWKYKLELSDSFQRHHHHLTCVNCGRIIPFDEDTGLVRMLDQFARGKNFVMRGHQLEIQGVCQNCI